MRRKIQRKLSLIKGQLAKEDSRQGLMRLVGNVHPADLAEILNYLEREEGSKILNSLEPERAALVLPEMDKSLERDLLQTLPNSQLSRILEAMPSDNAADILGELPEDRTTRVLSLMEKEEAEDLSQLLKYDEESAGGIMTADFFALPGKMTVKEAIERLRRSDIEAISYAYVVDEEGRLMGVLSLRKLITAPAQTELKEIMDSEVIRVTTDVDQEEVANLVRKYNLRAIPVVDITNILVGRVTVDDVLDVVEEEASEDIYRMAGTDEEELLNRGIFRAIRVRLPWLITTLVGTMLCAFVIKVFNAAIEPQTLIALLIFIPAIMAMGGNIGIQSSTIVVRGLATGRIDLSHLWKVLFREIRIGALMGLVCGMVVGTVAQLWQKELFLGLIVAGSMFTAITVAATVGTLVPLILKRFNIDPAVAAGPFVTTSNDITGLLIYFGLATWLLSLLK
ncbi:magnesium transporter [bacterium]|nr:magnesium transporter [bacterium]MCK4436862.1 magnesium transporter [bacterium]